MSVSELKLQIINRVTSMSDEHLLGEISRLVRLESEMDAIYSLNESEKRALKIGLLDVKSGNTHSSAEAEKMLAEWLKR